MPTRSIGTGQFAERPLGIVEPLRYAPDPGRGAIVARDGGRGEYVVVSALGMGPAYLVITLFYGTSFLLTLGVAGGGAAARSIGQRMTDYKVVVDKSTVPVGTADKVRREIASELGKRGAKIDFSVVANPVLLDQLARHRGEHVVILIDVKIVTEIFLRFFGLIIISGDTF